MLYVVCIGDSCFVVFAWLPIGLQQGYRVTTLGAAPDLG